LGGISSSYAIEPSGNGQGELASPNAAKYPEISLQEDGLRQATEQSESVRRFTLPSGRSFLIVPERETNSVLVVDPLSPQQVLE
jgi:hypothetical protein